MDKLAQDFVDSGTVNEAEGWATGFDPSILQNAQAQAQEKLEAHIATMDNPTVGDVIGGKKTIIKEYPALPSSLPNRIVIVGTRYDKLPSQLQQKIEFAFGADIFGEMIDPITFPFAKLNNEKVNLSFKPATQADEDALAALIPDGITDASQLPTSIPNSIRVVPELKVNGAVVKTSSASMGMGEELPFVTGIRFAGKGYVRTPRAYQVVAGSFLNVNVFAGSVSPVKLEKLQEKLKATKATLESANQTEIAALTRDDILGDMFYAGGLGYYAQLLSLSYISSLKAKGDVLSGSRRGYYQLAAGYGTIGYEPEVNSFFGQPRGIRTGGVAFDIPMIHITANQTGDAEKKRLLTLQIGTLSSALEHITPEQMFAPTDPNAPKPDAISAVKALQKASAAGQKIYQINQANMGQVLPLLNHDQTTKDEIRRALQAGKDVTTHTDKVSIPGGWSGFGYIITDPIVGDGVYKISGGMNGGGISPSGSGSGGSLLLTSVGTLNSILPKLSQCINNDDPSCAIVVAAVAAAVTLFSPVLGAVLGVIATILSVQGVQKSPLCSNDSLNIQRFMIGATIGGIGLGALGVVSAIGGLLLGLGILIFLNFLTLALIESGKCLSMRFKTVRWYV